MRCKKHMIILLAAIFLFAMATASAADLNDTAVAVDDGQLTDEIIQASENQENTIQASNNDEVNLSEDDSGKHAIGNDKKMGKTVTNHTFDAIDSAIESDCTIYLKPGTYTGNSFISIIQESNIKIIGNSTILDAQRQTRIFYIQQSSNITIQNITFKNGHNELSNGGAIEVYYSRDCIISNCTFINNTAKGYGGAIGWSRCDNGRVSNCTFINNTAKMYGGAIRWYNSNYGRVNNCTFINNTARYGGDAIYAESCDLNADYNWFGNTADNYNDQLPITNRVYCDCRLFLNATANPDTITGKDTSNVTFKLYQYGSDVISDYDNAPFKNLDLTITATKGNVKGTAKLGEPIQFTPTDKGTASVTATVENVRQTAEINVLKGDFDLLQDLVNNESLSIINLERNYTYNEFDTITDGVRINRPITINGNGYTIDAKGKSRIFYVTAGSINITNVTLKNGKASAGGAIYFSNAISNSNINATFINNTANGQDIFDGGGANYFRGIVSGLNIGGTYTGNTANGQGSYNDGGANYFRGIVSGSNIGGTYTGNNATIGGANYFGSVSGSNIGGTYTGNNAINGGANYFGSVSGSKVTGTYTGNNATRNGGANYFDSSVSGSNVSGTFINNTAEQGDGGANFFYGSVSGSNVSGTFINNTAEQGNGGANFFQSSVSGSNVSGTYTNNKANNDGGANYFYREVSGSNISGTYINNTASRGVIISFMVSNNAILTNVTIENAIFLNNKYDENMGVIYAEKTGVVAKNNWFGNNATNFETQPKATNLQMDSWLFLNGTNNQNNINFFLMSYDGTTPSEHDNTLLPKINLTVTTTDGILDKSVVGLDETVKFSPAESGISRVAAQIEDAAQTIEFSMGDFNILQGVINNASENSVINLTRNYTYNQYDTMTDGVLIDKNVTINGNGFTIDAKGKSRIFKAEASEVTISNLAIKNANCAGDGGAIYFAKNSIGSVINCNFTNNQATGDFSCGGAIYFRSNGNVTNCNFTNNQVTGYESCGGAIFFAQNSIGNVTNSNFINNNATDDGGAVYFYFYSTYTVENCNFTNNSASSEGGAIYSADRATGEVTNCKFTNNSAKYGGAIEFSGTGTVTNCNFTNNIATYYSGAVFFLNTGTVEDCNFVNNNATDDGGAVYFLYPGTVENCNFTGNNATTGSAIYFYSSSSAKTVSNSRFLNNRANAEALEVTKNDNNITITFTGKDNLLNAIYSRNDAEVTFTNVTYWSANGIATTESSAIKPPRSNKEAGQNITVIVVVNGKLVLSGVKVTDENGTIVLPIIAGENYYISARHETDSYYTEAEKTNSTMKFNVNVTSQTTNNKTVNITAKSNILNEVMPGKLLFILPNGTEINATYAGNGTWWAVHTFDDYSEYKINASYVGLDNVTVNNATISINKVNSTITLEDVVMNYGDSINVTVKTEGAIGITAKINDNPVSVVNNYTIPISGLNAGNYTLTVTTIADINHNNVTKTAKITVNKVNSTLTVEDIEFNYNRNGSTAVSYTGATGVNASVIDQPKAVVNVDENKITVSGLDAGNYTLTVTTIADDNHNTVNKTVKVTVNPVSSGLEVNGTDIFFGNDAILNYTAVNATGINMSISDWRGNALKEGVDYNITITDSQIIIRFFDDGTYTVNVTALTDDNHVPTSRNVTVHVNPICDLEVILTPMNLTANYGDTITWNATIISHGPSYPFNVNLYAYAQEGLIFKNAYSDSNYYHLSIPFTLYPNIPLYVFLKTLVNASNVNLTLNVSVRDEYFPDPNPDNNNASATVEIEYVKADLNITAPSQITVGDSASVEVALPEDATGNITVKVDGKEITTVSLINGSANVELSDLNAGNHTVEIIYSGDEKYSPANETKEITVSKQDTTAEVTIPANITVGDDANVNVKLPGDATGNVTLKLDGETVDTVPVTNGTANITIPSLTSGNHTVEITYSGDDKYNSVSETKEITVSKQDVNPEIAVDDANVNVKLPSDATGNVTVKVDDTAVSTVPVTNGTASVKLPKLSAGNHTVEISYSGDDKYNPSTKTATVSVDMDTTILTAKNVTATYNVNKYLTITLKDSQGSPIADATVSVKLKSTKNYTTNAKGQIKVKVSKLVPKTYIAQITFKGNDKYAESSATAKVKVKKATSKITAKAKTFKTTTKTKKYTVTLKANGKALKNKWVYLKVNGKTYKAKTNSKGKATFKITQLNKAGKFKATITFKGNDYYKKATKKATIKVKSVWKTIQKGSKNSVIVKKIQRALKNHGYYLEYNGHYLMVDGIFWDYTEMAVKEFQNDKTLKVTGKVDEKTAKKLGII